MASPGKNFTFAFFASIADFRTGLLFLPPRVGLELTFVFHRRCIFAFVFWILRSASSIDILPFLLWDEVQNLRTGASL